MPSIDERVVAMSFENQVFETRVAQTMGTLSKLDAAIKNLGGTSGFDKIEAQASKVTLQAPMSALDKLKAKLGRSGEGAAQGFSDIERSGARITLASPFRVIDNLVNKFGRLSAGTTFTDIEKAADRTTLSGLSTALDGVTAKFSILQGAASVALGNITSMAVTKAGAFAKGFAFAPIMDGLHEYETNLKSIQTIQANTDRPLTEINRSLEELNHYSDQTIYNFSEMAKNIGTFTAAGVDLKTATSSIKGIANLAALSGSSSQQAATAMYQLSQAIAAGKVGLQDWNSVVNAGMGGKKFQTALTTTAVAMGNLGAESVKLEGPLKKLTLNGKSFRESIMSAPGTNSWLKSEVLVNTLATLDGRFSKAALSAELTKNGLKKYTAAQVEATIADNRAALEKKNGVKYTDEQFKALMKLSDSAFKSATEVKTLGQVFDVAKETIGSGWAASFQNIFGNLTEAKKLFTGMSGAINGFINKSSLARNELLAGWKDLGGRADVIQGIKNIFNVLFDVLGKIGHAFREIFPAKTSKDLAEMSRLFLVFTAHLNNSPATINNIARVFRGLFAVLHIGWTVAKDVTGAIFDLLGIVGKGSGGILNFAGSIGDFLVSLDKAVSQGNLFTGFLSGLVAGLGGVVDLIKAAGRSIGSIFSGADNATGMSNALNDVIKAGGPLGQVADMLVTAWDRVVHIFNRVKDILKPAFDAIGDQASRLSDTLGTAFSTGNFDQTMAVLQTGFLGGILLILRRFRSSLEISLSGGIFDKVNNVFGALTGNLKAMQKNLQAKTLFAIAASLGVLVAGVYVLSTIDGKKLTTAMSAMAVGMGELVGVMGLLGKMVSGPGKAGILMMPFIAASMIGLAISATILAAAMKIFATMSWEDLVKGLSGVGGGLTAIGFAMKAMGPMTLIQGPALIAIAIGLSILAGAVKQFGDIPWKQMVQGLLGMGFAFVSLAAGLNFMGPSLILTGPGLIAVAIGMSMLAGAVASFGSMKIGDLGKGIGAIAASLVALGIGLLFIPPTVGLTGAGLILVAAGLTGLSAAIGILGSMKISTLIKGIVAMGGALVVLGTGLLFMSGTLLGSVALLGAAAAFAILGPALAFMGSLKWSTILSGLGAIAVTLGVLAIAGLLVAGPITALSFALGALGIAFGLITAPIYLFAKALQILGASGSKGIGIMIAALTAFVALLPKIIIDFLKGIVDIVVSIAELAPKVVSAVGVIIGQLLAVVIDAAPKLAVAANALILAFLTVVNNNAPKLIESGIKLILGFLSGIAQNIQKVVTQAGAIVVGFLNGLAAKAPSIARSGLNALVSFLGGIASGAGRVASSAASIVLNFLNGISSQIFKVVPIALGMVTRFLNSVASKVDDIISAGVHVIVTFLQGLAKGLPRIVEAAVDVATRFIRAVGRQAPRLADAGFKALIDFLHGIAKAIRENEGDLIEAGVDIAKAIVEGLVDGLGKVGHLVRGALMKVIDVLPGFAKKILDIHSPSRVFHEIGENTMKGLANGIIDSAPLVHMSLGRALKTMVDETGDAKQLGHFLGKDFMDGLTGAMDTRSEAHTRIDDTFASLRDKLKEQTGKIKAQIQKDREKLKSELAKDHPSQVAIQSIAADIRDNTALLNSAKKATTNLMGQFTGQKNQMIALAASYDDLGVQLDTAQQKLDQIKQDRDQFLESTTTRYFDLPGIDETIQNSLDQLDQTNEQRAEKAKAAAKRRSVDQVAAYKQSLLEQIKATEHFNATLQKLREMGLDDTTYKKLLEDGFKDQDFADQLLAGGKASITQLNTLDAQLLKNAGDLANNATKNLYKVGVDAAQGLVDGLKARQGDIQYQMDQIATAMVNSIKRQLGIRSPSRVMAEVGKFTAQGVIQGLQMTSQRVADAAAGVGEDAASAMSDSLSHISDMLNSEVDPDLTITPVLDLSQVRKDAQTLGGIVGETSITAGTSFGQASAASQEVSASQEAAATAAADEAPTFNFEQNNYSPEALSDVEIYRQTKNQLGQLKSVLGVPT